MRLAHLESPLSSRVAIRQKDFAFANNVRLMFQMQIVSPNARSRYVKPNT